MKEIKERLKVLAALCIDKDLHFNTGYYAKNKAICWSVFFLDDNEKLSYISGVSECAAEWIDDSIDRINEVIAKVEAL